MLRSSACLPYLTSFGLRARVQGRGDRGRVGVRQDGHEPVAAAADTHAAPQDRLRQRRVQGPRPGFHERPRYKVCARQPDFNDLPGPDDFTEPVPAHIAADDRGTGAPPGHEQGFRNATSDQHGRIRVRIPIEVENKGHHAPKSRSKC